MVRDALDWGGALSTGVKSALKRWKVDVNKLEKQVKAELAAKGKPKKAKSRKKTGAAKKKAAVKPKRIATAKKKTTAKKKASKK